MGMIGKLLIEINFESIYVITAELYPTNVSLPRPMICLFKFISGEV